MKKNVLYGILCVIMAVFLAGCKGGDLKTGPSGNPGQTKISFRDNTLRVTNAYANSELFNLVCDGVETESIEDSLFDKAVVTGDYDGQWKQWRIVNYVGGANVAFADRSGNNVNIFFWSKDQKRHCWLDLGKAACTEGCRIDDVEDHTRHVIHLF